MAEPRSRRRTFGPVVLAGLAAGTLAAVAASKPWVSGESGSVDTGDPTYALAVDLDTARESPLAAALALVLLACWGVLLVTRGRFRRAVALLGAVAAVGLAVATALAARQLQDGLSEALVRVSGTDTVATSLTGWYAAAAVAAVLCVVTALAAAALVGDWPEMGSRYDRPTAPGTRDEPAAEGNLDLWKALDEGRDPTA